MKKFNVQIKVSNLFSWKYSNETPSENFHWIFSIEWLAFSSFFLTNRLIEMKTSLLIGISFLLVKREQKKSGSLKFWDPLARFRNVRSSFLTETSRISVSCVIRHMAKFFYEWKTIWWCYKILSPHSQYYTNTKVFP